MSHDEGRRPAPGAPLRPSCIAAAVVLAATLAAGPVFAQAQAQAPAGAKKVVKAANAGKTKVAGPAAPKAPVAAKNVAIGADAIPAQPTAFLSAGCLDARHGHWLNAELGAGAWWTGADGSSTERAGFGEGPHERDRDGGRESGESGEREVARGEAGTRCVPFAAVRSPADRIESLAFLPVPAPPAEAAELRRVMVVSRLDLSSAATTSWHDLADAPAGHREVWMPAAGVLAGEMADQVPPRWQRDVSLLVRQMRKHAQAASESTQAWVRLVLQGEGDAADVAAVELVDDGTGHVIDSAIWLARDDAPGGFVSARGGDHERVLWQSPVDYRRISRGVGTASVIVRKRVFAKPKTPGGKPRMVVRSFRSRGQHQGIDFAAPSGTPVVTVAEGTVVHAGRSGGYGNLVVVDHGGGITTYYAHLSAFGTGVQEGARVERGQEIGQVGSTGMSTGPHLHYEIRRDGKYLDPADPAQSLPTWGLVAAEHRAVLTRLLSLSLSREGAFARATRQPSMASAPQTAEAE
ncbi:MAG: M23 family metallopeptidase [Burkholderiales bacterium]|nr:M23 family metallopeptidase [Burkholderiales bacterium]